MAPIGRHLQKAASTLLKIWDITAQKSNKWAIANIEVFEPILLDAEHSQQPELETSGSDF